MYGFIKPLLIFYTLFVICAPFASRFVGDKQFAGQEQTAAAIIKTEAVQRKLNPDEKILWSSNVDADKIVGDAVPVSFVGIIFALMPVLMNLMLSRIKRPLIFRLIFALPFMLVGLYMVTGPYWARRNAVQTVCLLTDRRALEVINGALGSNIKYTSHSFITPVLHKYNPDKDRSSLIFYEDHTKDSTVRKGFIGINDGDNALRILKDKLDEAELNR